MGETEKVLSNDKARVEKDYVGYYIGTVLVA
jgi:hypothetical protein